MRFEPGRRRIQGADAGSIGLAALMAIGSIHTAVAIAAENASPGFPADPSCQRTEPPADAGAVATPGGFMLVHPRNNRIHDDYSGCKTLWIYDDPDVPRRWATLLFERGLLIRAIVWDRDAPDRADRVCDRRSSGSEACGGVEGNELVALRLASWPRVCMSDPARKECQGDPR